MRRIVLGVGAMIVAALLGYVALHDHRVASAMVRVAPENPREPYKIRLNARPTAAASVAAPAPELLAAANRGDVASQSALCLLAMNAAAASDDYADAAYWCARAAESGHADSQVWYARLFQTGKGVAQDPDQAAAWYEKAAQQQNAYAMYMLGRMLIEKNDAAAVARGTAMLQQSAALGNSDAGHTVERLGIRRDGRRRVPPPTR